jgi:hypothetical protein
VVVIRINETVYEVKTALVPILVDDVEYLVRCGAKTENIWSGAVGGRYYGSVDFVVGQRKHAATSFCVSSSPVPHFFL